MVRIRFAALYLVFLIALTRPAGACTVFRISAGDTALIARNYDWRVADGAVIKNPRGLRKTAYVPNSQQEKNPVTWVARFGSVTFNQYGREFATGGMNEAGLVAEGLFVPGNPPAIQDGRPAIQQRQWVQYHLDNYATVSDVLATVHAIRMMPPSAPLNMHFFLADRTGDSAVVECLDNTLRIYHGATLPVPALTNSPYHIALESVQTNQIPTPDPYAANRRFSQCARRSQQYSPEKQPESPLELAMKVLKQMEWEIPTQWRVVYNPAALVIHVQSTRQQTINPIQLKRLNYSCTESAGFVDIHSDRREKQDNPFGPYSSGKNADLVNAAVTQTPFLQNLPPEAFEPRIAYPQNAVCTEPLGEDHNSSLLKYTRLGVGITGDSFFVDETKAMNVWPSKRAMTSFDETSSGIRFFRAKAGWQMPELHHAPKRQYVLVLKGVLEITTSTGVVRQFHPGSILLVEDTYGNGHRTRNAGEGDLVLAWVGLEA